MLPKILIVDDSKTIRAQVRDMLPRGNFEVSEAKDGVEGFARIAQELPNLVLLDFFMPHMNGWEVLQKIKTQPQLKTIPVVVMTGRKEEVLDKVPDLFDDYACIEKPFEQKMLMDAVKSALTKAKSRQPVTAPTPSEPLTAATVGTGVDQSDQALKTQVQVLASRVQQLTEANTRMQTEMDGMKRQVSQLVAFIRQKFQ